ALADSKQVQRGREQPEPGPERDRMKVDGVPVGDRSPDQPRRELEEQRLAELESVDALREDRDSRHPHADEQRRNRDEKSGDRTGDANVEQHSLAGNRLSDANEGAERAG